MRPLLLVLIALPLSSHADLHDPAAPALTPIAVRARLDGFTARFSTRFTTIAPLGPSHVAFDLPEHAVITGATITANGLVHHLALQRTDEATRHFDDAMAAAPGAHGRSVAIVEVVQQDGQLDLLAPATGRMVVDVELSAPTCFDADARFVEIPATWLPRLDVALRRPVPADLDARCGGPGADLAWIGFPSRDLAARPSGDARIDATAGRLALVGVESYVRGAGTTRVQVIAYARTAHALLPSWTMAQAALPRLDRELRALATKNGSNVDAGLAEAAVWLARVGGTPRVILISDERLSDRVAALSSETLRQRLPANTLVHAVALDGGDELVRDPDGVFAPLAVATAGLAVRGGGSDAGPAAAAMLVRPITLDDVVIRAQGWTPSPSLPGCQLDDTGALAEGRSCVGWFAGTALAGPIVVTGKLWGQRVMRVLRPDPMRGTTLARELVGRDPGFDGAVMEQIEDAARAVSSGWSLFGAWGGTDGYEEVGGGFGISGSSGGCCDGGTIGTIGRGSVGRWVTHLDVRAQLRDALRVCHAERRRVDLTLETTVTEIVDVKVTKLSAQPDELPEARQATTRCIEDAIWDTALAIQDPAVHETVELTIGPL
ncbi:MAG: hypothetical protein NT062_37735 [Proteobacteria bacterium]|nr:hypothetical protein [Pseudomonadota bacterium]